MMFYLLVFLLLIGIIFTYKLQQSDEEKKARDTELFLQNQRSRMANSQPVTDESSFSHQIQPSEFVLPRHNSILEGALYAFTPLLLVAFSVQFPLNDWEGVLVLALAIIQALWGGRMLYNALCRQTVLDDIGIRRESVHPLQPTPKASLASSEITRSRQGDYLLRWHDVLSVKRRKYKLFLALNTPDSEPYVFDAAAYMLFSDDAYFSKLRQFINAKLQSAQPCSGKME